MNEEQAVLNFFSQPENLPLALSVAEQMDHIRQRMNNEFWRESCAHISALVPNWRVSLTEDRNTPDCYVGLHLQPAAEQSAYLRPMMEQQLTEGAIRIYFGLMWNAPPAADKIKLADITALQLTLQNAGYKSNEHFLAWRWTSHYPQRKHFLLSQSTRPGELINEATAPLLELLASHATELSLANNALRDAGTSATVSLDQLRMNLQRY